MCDSTDIAKAPPPSELMPGGTGLRLVLASRSPRRRQLLNEAGFAHDAIDPGVDDGTMRPGTSSPRHWVASLACMKARAGFERLPASDRPLTAVLGADTVVVKKSEIIGQPKGAEDAQRIVERLQDGEHEVLTGVCLMVEGPAGEPIRRLLLTDSARVRVGRLGPERIEPYIQSGQWRGKAGAYNLSERMADGWPITFDGDPGTIMGLPMRSLAPRLRSVLRGALHA